MSFLILHRCPSTVFRCFSIKRHSSPVIFFIYSLYIQFFSCLISCHSVHRTPFHFHMEQIHSFNYMNLFFFSKRTVLYPAIKCVHVPSFKYIHFWQNTHQMLPEQVQLKLLCPTLKQCLLNYVIPYKKSL